MVRKRLYRRRTPFPWPDVIDLAVITRPGSSENSATVGGTLESVPSTIYDIQ